MRSKYLGGQSNIFNQVCPPNASFCWRAINKSTRAIQDGFCWHVGDGLTVSSCFDNWLTEWPLCNIVGNVPDSFADMKVGNIIANGSWAVDALDNQFFKDVKDKIQSFPWLFLVVLKIG